MTPRRALLLLVVVAVLGATPWVLGHLDATRFHEAVASATTLLHETKALDTLPDTTFAARQRALAQTARETRKALQEFTRQTEAVQRAKATAFLDLAEVNLRLDAWQQSEDCLLLARSADLADERALDATQRARCELEIGALRLRNGRVDAAMQSAEAATELLTGPPTDDATCVVWARARRMTAECHLRRRDRELANATLQTAETELGKWPPHDGRRDHELAATLMLRATALAGADLTSAAEQLLRRAVLAASAAHRVDPRNTEFALGLTASQRTLGHALLRLDKPAAAIELARSALNTDQELRLRHPNAPRTRLAHVLDRALLAEALGHAGGQESATARRLAAEARQDSEALVKRCPGDIDVLLARARTLRVQAFLASAAKDLTAARELHREHTMARHDITTRTGNHAAHFFALSQARVELGRCLLALGDLDAAAPALGGALLELRELPEDPAMERVRAAAALLSITVSIRRADLDGAFAELEKMTAAGDLTRAQLDSAPELAPLRRDPRFRRIRASSNGRK